MLARTSIVVCVAVLAAYPIRAEDEASLRDWAAAPYWSPARVPAAGSARQGLARTALVPAATPLPFVSLAPCRLLDTRAASNFPNPFGGPPLTQGTARDVPVAGNCGIPPTAQAVSFNFTVTNPLGSGFLVAWPAASPIPQTSILNYGPSQTVGNYAVVGLGAGGAISVAAGVSGIDLIVDVNGYYAPQTVVNTLNGLSGDVAVAAGANTTITPAGNTLTISSAGTISAVTAGTGLAGGGTSGTVTLLIPPGGIAADRIGTAQVVKSLNGLTDGVTLAAGPNVTITPNAGTLTIASTGTLTGVTAGAGLTGGGGAGNVSLAVSLPNARARQTIVQTFTNGAFATVDLDNLAFANGASLSANQIVVGRTGVYQISGEILWVANATAVRALFLNSTFGGELAGDTRPSVAGIETVQNVSTLARLSAGEGVYMTAAQASGANLATSLFSGRAAALNVVWVAP